MDKSVPPGAALLLALIYKTETGKMPPECYDVIYGHNQHKLAKPITQMTIGDLVDAQKGFTGRFKSSASGAAQFMRLTLIDLSKELHLSGTQIFDGNLQDRLAYHLLLRRGYNDFIAGKISRTDFGRRLAQEWASFPVLAPTKGGGRDKSGKPLNLTVNRGASYYAGDPLNKALIKPETVEALLDRIKALPVSSANKVEPPAPVETIVVEKPVVADPGELGTPAGKSKTVWLSIFTALGTPLAAFGGLDWRVQMALVVAVVGFAIYAIKRRFDLAKAVRSLHAELAE